MPSLRLELNLADQAAAPHFFLSQLILILAWAFSGPLTAAILTGLSTLIVFYLCLGTRQPAFFLQVLEYLALFLFMVFFLYEIQKITNQKRLSLERLAEDINLTAEEIQKRIALKEALERKIERLLGLQKLSAELKDLKESDAVARRLAEHALRVLPRAEECAVYAIRPEHEELALLAGLRTDEASVREKEGTVFDQWVLKRCQAMMIEDARNDFRFLTDPGAASHALRSVCASPLVTENKVLGVVRASSRSPKAFNSDDLRLLDVISSLGAVHLRNILLYERMGELAIRDSLTGLYLNRYFQYRLSEEILRGASSGKPLSLILLDIDHFKRYNDEFGHAAGDLVLRSIATLLHGCLRSTDLAARYGGEEFVVLLPDTAKDQAAQLAERIRASIEAHRIVLRRTESRVTASLGVSSYPEDGRAKEELIWAVDRALYDAKEKGRNRVVVCTAARGRSKG
ncbi:MAG: hypothetical protein MOGMAGMI_00486 [Candidatus Omnitrophica bacterium]|nr:hypothetical protein [Candidatus Omnitrophota bacterium]